MTRGRLILRITVLAVFAVLVVGHVAGQIIVPDRLQGGTRMGALVTPADQGVLTFDTVRTLPTESSGRDTWWHRHALFPVLRRDRVGRELWLRIGLALESPEHPAGTHLAASSSDIA